MPSRTSAGAAVDTVLVAPRKKLAYPNPLLAKFAKGCPFCHGIGGLLLGERELSVGAAVVHALYALKQRCRPQLVGVVSIHPSQVGVKSRLIIVGHWRESERHARIGNGGESAAAAPPAAIRAIHARHIGEEVARSEGNALRETVAF